MQNGTMKKVLREKAALELVNNILPYWIQHTVDEEYGGFYGHVKNDNTVMKEAPKGAVICSRILWTYSTAYRVLGKQEYLEMAEKAYYYLTEKFWDNQYVGVYWILDHKGNVINGRKQIYAQAFAVYGLSEFYRATGEVESLIKAIELFNLIEDKSYDKEYKGYFEAYTREWQKLEDMRLSHKDMNAEKSMNTNLHVMEAYTNLLRVWNSEKLRSRLSELIDVTIRHMVNPMNNHFMLYFDPCWNPKSELISYGHDIEGSWLLVEAAVVLCNVAGSFESYQTLLAEAREVSVKIAQTTYNEAMDSDGSLFYEASPSGVTNGDKHWWPQAEAVVGYLNAYELTSKEYFLDAANRCWNYIEERVVDKVKGEWFRKLTREGIPYDDHIDDDQYKAGLWKCPYHNARVCFEIMERLKGC